MTTVIPKISKISQRVIRVLGCNPGAFTLQGTNTYILGTGPNRMLIDTGEPNIPEYIQILKKVVKENNISLKKILLTHWHLDHVGGTNSILEEIADKDCKVYKFKDPEHDSFTNDRYQLNYLNDQDEISVDGATLKVYHTPGHAIDHLILYLKENNCLFSGDCILGEGSAVFEDLLSYLNSLRKIAELKPVKLYPGHGPVVDDPQKKVQEYIDKRMEREQQILQVLQKNPKEFVSVVDIVTETYPNLPIKLMFGAQYNVYNHLDKLFKENRLEKIEDDDLVVKFRLKQN